MITAAAVHVYDVFSAGEKARLDKFWQGLGPSGSGQEPGRVTLEFGAFPREGLGEGRVEDYPADIR